MSVAAPRLVGRQSPTFRCKQLLLGPPPATSRVVRERLRKLVALAVLSSDAISSTAYRTEQIMLVLVPAGAVTARTRMARVAAWNPAIQAPHGDHGRFRRLLHDQTGQDLFVELNRQSGINVAIVHPPAAAVLNPAMEASPRQAAT